MNLDYEFDSKQNFTTLEKFNESYRLVFETFASGKTKDFRWRKWQLKQMYWMIQENKELIYEAAKLDLHKGHYEAYFEEVFGICDDILHTIKNLEEYAGPIKPKGFNAVNALGRTIIKKEPLGVSLIVGPWNFPFLLIFQPLVAAIAAGCCTILKPSDLALNCQNLICDLVEKYLDTSAIQVVPAGPSEMKFILDAKFNHIFYTGSPGVARIIATAAAKHLTPITLELGGQGPAIVDETADIDLAAKRIASTKLMNMGQICLNVNHVIVHPTKSAEFIERLKFYFDQFLDSSKGPGKDGFARIINSRNVDRLSSLLESTKGKVEYGGDVDRDDLFITPTIVSKVTTKDPILSQELFGPILPILEGTVEDAVKCIRSFEHPLAIYIFSKCKDHQKYIVENTLSGGVTINDTIMHAGAPGAPFGGVGEAGYGYYHGEYGVLEFSHLRTIVNMPAFLEKVTDFRYPPYSEKILKACVLPKPSFSRNETLEDQKISLPGGGFVAGFFGILIWIFERFT